MYRVAACGGSDPVPTGFDPIIVGQHCKEMRRRFGDYKKEWADQATAFIGNLRPQGLTTTVVYPFGGGDLTSALVVYPDATEITTISLEAAGDVRAIDHIQKGKLEGDLASIGHDVERLFRSAHSTTKSLQAASHSTLPGTIMFALSAMSLRDLEPRSLRYFTINPDGTLKYLTEAELDQGAIDFEAAAADRAAHRRPTTHDWREQESPYANMEITFGKPGDPATRVYRHIVANLDDPHLNEDRRVITHLELKGKVAVMTKAASFLLWFDDFTIIRNYLLTHLVWMISDASGIPPSYADPAGFEQVTFGEFTGPYFIKDPKNTRQEFIKMWKKNPHQALPFRFGYPDEAKHNHMMITRPKAP